YPIYISQEAESQSSIIVSAGKIGRSVGVDPKVLAKFVDAEFADIATQD
ncbi:Cys-tRNA(Pro) deacylase, partial [Lactobacillus rhamnosus]|nr:Cys-tRNA(Pro) deacylase [Lacticaseibacillus rhamnosus]